MRRLSVVMATLLAMAVGDAGAACPDVSLKTHMPRRVSLGKTFVVKARVQLGAKSPPVNNLYLGRTASRLHLRRSLQEPAGRSRGLGHQRQHPLLAFV